MVYSRPTIAVPAPETRTAGWQKALRRRFQIDRVATQYQPIVTLSRGDTVAFEALARFGKRDGTWINPQTVFESLHEAGPTMLREAEYHLKLLQLIQAPRHGTLFLNMSPLAVLAEGCCGARAWLGHLHLLRPDVVVELMESDGRINAAAMDNASQTLEKAGFSVALDDIGAPHTLLSLEQLFLAKYLKFDRFWLQRLRDDQTGRAGAALACLVSFARSTGKTTVLEGIETEADLETARRVGTDLVQGFLFGAGAMSAPVSLNGEPIRPPTATAKGLGNPVLDRRH